MLSIAQGGQCLVDVFVSYKAEDRARVAPLVRALESDGVSVWWDAHIGAGDEWRETILRHLENARAVIVVWSRRSVGPQGQFVRDEASRAVKRKTYLPVRIDRVDPPLGFGEMQAHDLAGWKGDPADLRYKGVASALRDRFGVKARSSGVKSETKLPVSRRGLMAGGAAVAIVAAGVGTWLWPRRALARGDSIAVMPFENLSGDPSQAYFSDGIAEELRNALARIPALKVVARTSSEAVRNEDARAAAQKLGVSHILTGSVRRSPALLRISAQLVDNAGLEQWSEAYDRPAGDTLQIQTDIATNVADALRLRLGGSAVGGAIEGGTSNPDAHDLLLKGQGIFYHGEEAGRIPQALGLVDAALALDPKYADALAFKAVVQTVQAGEYASSAAESQELYRVAKGTAQAAIGLAPRSRPGYSALASILDQQLQFREALNQYRVMMALPGSDADLVMYAVSLSEFRYADAAHKLIDRAIAADSLNPQTYGWKAYILANGRQYADAAAAAQRMIALEPNSLYGRSFHAYCLMMLGNNGAARREFDAIGNDGSRGAPAFLGVLAVRQKDAALAKLVLSKLRNHQSDALFYQYAQIYAQQGERDEAMDALQRAWIARDPGLGGLLVDPLLDPLRSDPRFQALVKKLNFPT